MNKICPILKSGTLLRSLMLKEGEGWDFNITSDNSFCMTEDCMLWRNDDCTLVKIEDRLK